MKPLLLIHVEPEAPSKPRPGAPCNGCGICCLSEPCPLGMLLSVRRRGACALLRWRPKEGSYSCGAIGRLPWLDRLLRRWIGAGTGCDCELEVEPATQFDRQSGHD